jgi:hypothetical protein
MLRIEMLDQQKGHAGRLGQAPEEIGDGLEPPAEAPMPTTGKDIAGSSARARRSPPVEFDSSPLAPG